MTIKNRTEKMLKFVLSKLAENDALFRDYTGYVLENAESMEDFESEENGLHDIENYARNHLEDAYDYIETWRE